MLFLVIHRWDQQRFYSNSSKIQNIIKQYPNFKRNLRIKKLSHPWLILNTSWEWPLNEKDHPTIHHPPPPHKFCVVAVRLNELRLLTQVFSAKPQIGKRKTKASMQLSNAIISGCYASAPAPAPTPKSSASTSPGPILQLIIKGELIIKKNK